jgi:transposase
MKIVEQNIHHKDASSAMIRMVPDLRYTPLCHDCGSEATTTHSKGHRRFIRDLNMANSQVFLQVEYRKIGCPVCGGVRVEFLDFADAGNRVTHRLARYVYDLFKVMTLQDVAEHLDLDPKTVKAIDKSFLEKSFGQTDGHGLRVLAIDEIALRKGHHYMTVVMDYFSGRIVWMGENRDKETLDRFFAELTDSQKRGIEAVAMDMWEPFINRIQHHCPDEQANHLEQVLALNEILSILYVLKDHLKLVYYYSDRRKVKKTLAAWCRMAETIDHPAVRRFIGRLRCFEYGILNHADYPISTSGLEGANNKIKVIKRKAYGFHDSEYFALKVKQAFAA